MNEHHDINKNKNSESEFKYQKWPPLEWKPVKIKYDGKILYGISIVLINNSTSCIVMLINNLDFVDPVFVRNKIYQAEQIKKKFSNPLFLLSPSHIWTYVDSHEFMAVFYDNTRYSDDKVLKLLNNGYSVFVNKFIDQDYQSANNAVDHKYTKAKAYNNQHYSCDGSSKLTLNYLLNDSGPNLNNVDFSVNLNDNDKILNESDQSTKDTVKKHLYNNGKPDKTELYYPMNQTVTLKHLIESKEDYVNEGKKLLNNIKKMLINKKIIDNVDVYSTINFYSKIINGYIYFYKGNDCTKDYITKSLIGNDLKFFSWQFGIPINYNVLKHSLFSNTFQANIEDDNILRKEAELILAQEYLISIQPQPIYLLWCLIRFLQAWESVDYLKNNIRMVKVLINQYRSRGDLEYNIQNGVLPSIIIYPKYGYVHAKNILTELNKLFGLYVGFGWSCSHPSYFIKLNNLIYYTNGAIDLKLYYRNVLKHSNNSLVNRTFNRNYTVFKNGESII